MPYYRLYCLNEAGRFYTCDEIDAPDDADAIRQAEELRPGVAAELWQQGRKVHTFKVAVD